MDNAVAGVAAIATVAAAAITYGQYASEQSRIQAETTKNLMNSVQRNDQILAKVIAYRHKQCTRARREKRKCDWHERAAMDFWLANHHEALCEMMDLDGNGKLDYNELKVGLQACMMPEDQTDDFIDYLFRLTHENRRALDKIKQEKKIATPSTWFGIVSRARPCRRSTRH